MTIRISDHFSLPVEIVTQTVAVLAKRRSGKSYLLARFAEELWDAGQQVVILDPKGDWWGLRSSADGKGPGIPILIVGGEHGDIALDPSSGEELARLAVEERVGMLLDLSDLRKHEVATFCALFLETLYRLKAKEQYRTAMMLIVDEADAVAPQSPAPNEARMLGAMEDVVRRGGQRGIGCAMATQRAAVLNKNVLTQAEVMIALRLIAPQDIKAMMAWIDVHGSDEERERLVSSLPALPIGTAWFWSPGWPTGAGIFEQVKVGRRRTFDSGATPKPGETKKAPKTLADVDLAAVRERLAAVIERAKADDPKALRARIAELERELAAKRPTEPQRVPVPFFDNELFEAFRRKASEDLALACNNLRAEFRVYASKATEAAASVQSRTASPAKNGLDEKPVDKAQDSRPPARRPDKSEGTRQSTNGTPLPKMHRAILTAVAQYPDGLRRDQLLLITGYADSGPFSSALGALRAAMALNDAPDGPILITSIGRRMLGTFTPLPTGQALFEYWRNKLGRMGARILVELQKAGSDGITRAGLLEASGYADSGPFSSELGKLRRHNLAHDRGNRIVLNQELT